MPQVAVKAAGEIAYREAEPSGATNRAPVLCIHGWPQSSYMWRHMLPALAAAGRRAVALDLPGFGDTPFDPPSTFERHVAAVEEFHRRLDLGRVVLMVHDTGGLIGLRWACEHPDAVAGLVISNTGFFPDVEWIEIATTMRTPGQGETLVDSTSRAEFGTLLKSASESFDDDVLDEYWKAFESREARHGWLQLYRSFEMDELAPYQEKLAALGVPALVLWGQADEFLPVDYARRFAEQIPGARLVMLQDIGHFLFEDEPERCADAVLTFLDESNI